jgi:acetylornithine deacetylase/succinyl-diaminopimelate desuccinylase-like protein
VRRSAQAVAQALRDAGVEHVEVLEIPGVHPYVYGEWLHRPGAPTVLLYGHHDVQPPGRAEKWLSPAFEPTERGGRLYGRGTADDKGGVMAHVAAVGSYLRAAKTLPLNVKFIIEGEEEIGSMNLGRFLEQYRAKMAADFIVLTDTRNYDVGHPALTYQLRGICQVDVEVQGLHQPLHSGNSGPVPDPVQILCAMIADLRKPNGALNVPGLYAKVARPSAKQLARIRKLPLSEAKFKKDSGMLPGVRLWGESQFSLLERMWTRPALTVIALEARPFLGSSNQIIEAARARLSLRTVPGMDAREAGRLIVKKLTTKPPYGVKVTAKIKGTTPWWRGRPSRPRAAPSRRASARRRPWSAPAAPSASCSRSPISFRARALHPDGRGRSQHPGPLGEREPPPGRLGEGDAFDHPPLRRARAPAAAVARRRSGLTSCSRRCTMRA